jgi:hypothetical protein
VKKTLTKTIQPALLTFLLSFGASFLTHAATDNVEVKFSKFLDKRMDRISAIDKNREEVFRQYRIDNATSIQRPRGVLNKGRFFQTEWANERLIPDIEQYSVPALITEMMKRGIEGANPDGFDGRIVLEVDKLSVGNFPLATISNFNTRMKGKVKLFDSAGELVTEHKIWTALVPKLTAERNYQGPDYAYIASAGETRIGPIAAEFSAKALEKVFPGYDAPDPIFLQTDPTGR